MGRSNALCSSKDQPTVSLARSFTPKAGTIKARLRVKSAGNWLKVHVLGPLQDPWMPSLCW